MLLKILFVIIFLFAIFFIIIICTAVKRIITSKGTNEKIKIGETVIAVKKTGNVSEVIQ